jgi:SOS-response transcriptional repressor LexA
LDSTPTVRQGQIIVCIAQSVEARGYPPSVREIGENVGLSSSSTVQCHIRNLAKHGFLRRDPDMPRALALTERGLEIAAGLLGRPLAGLLAGTEAPGPYDEPDESVARARASMEGILANEGVLERAIMRVREKQSWLNDSEATSVVEAVFGAIRECLG